MQSNSGQLDYENFNHLLTIWRKLSGIYEYDTTYEITQATAHRCIQYLRNPSIEGILVSIRPTDSNPHGIIVLSTEGVTSWHVAPKARLN